MKKHLFILQFTISLFYTSLFAQWVQQTLPVSGQIRDLVFLNKDTGFVALNNNDVLLRTTNGGTNWNTVNTFRINKLCVGDNKTVFGTAVNGSKMYRSFDGGATFDSVGAPGGGYCSFYFVNKDTGWSSGLTGIFMTTNGGNSFSLVSTDANCGSVMFFVRQKYNNYYCGWHIDNSLYKTTNNGINWSVVSGISTNVINMFFLNKDTGWVTDIPPADNYKILFTSNAGVNWTVQLSTGGGLTRFTLLMTEKVGAVQSFSRYMQPLILETIGEHRLAQ